MEHDAPIGACGGSSALLSGMAEETITVSTPTKVRGVMPDRDRDAVGAQPLDGPALGAVAAGYRDTEIAEEGGDAGHAACRWR